MKILSTVMILSSDEDRQQAIQENRELSDQEKYQL